MFDCYLRNRIRRNWESVTLGRYEAVQFRKFLRLENIEYEPSAEGDNIHFEVYVNKHEREMCDDFLMKGANSD